MKILLTTLNAKFVHTALGLWSIYQYCRDDCPELEFREYNINQDLAWVCGEIFLERAAVVAFSCNIWNLAATLSISRRLKVLAPQTVMILGGPEVWDDPEGIMERHPWVDQIIVGEGELTFKEWLAEYATAAPRWERIRGLVYRNPGGKSVRNEARPDIADLNQLPFPYPADLTPFRDKLVYYEASRGCPYHCQYCLSANEHGVRFLPLERVKAELLRFIEAEIVQVKFVDRSFNCHPGRAKAIWKFLLEHPCKTNFHFEIVGDLLDEESLAILRQAPPGMFQFEVGVQSTNPETLRLIERRTDFGRLAEQCGRLIRESKVFVHLDLIAGLPGEDYQSFARTFDDNLAIRPHRLQLGFLKLLHGSGIRNKAAEYGYIYTEEAPYEVLANDWIRYDELLRLKVIEDLLERYYNSERFRLSFEYLFQQFSSPFKLFEAFGAWWKKRGHDRVSHKSRDLYGYLLQFGTAVLGAAAANVLRNTLKYDLLTSERLVELPDWAGGSDPELQRAGYRFWQDEALRQRYIPDWADRTVREIQRRVVFAAFDFDPAQLAADPAREPAAQRSTYLFVYRSAHEGDGVAAHLLPEAIVR